LSGGGVVCATAPVHAVLAQAALVHSVVVAVLGTVLQAVGLSSIKISKDPKLSKSPTPNSRRRF